MSSSNSSRADKFKFKRNSNHINDGEGSHRANTTKNEGSIYKTMNHSKRGDLGTASLFNGSSAVYRTRDAMSTRGGVSMGSRMDIESQF